MLIKLGGLFTEIINCAKQSFRIKRIAQLASRSQSLRLSDKLAKLSRIVRIVQR